MTEKQLNFNGVKVFSATMKKDREELGDKVSAWLRSRQEAGDFLVTDYVVTQSSDQEFHCLAITVFYVEGDRARDMAPLPVAKPIGSAPKKSKASQPAAQ